VRTWTKSRIQFTVIALMLVINAIVWARFVRRLSKSELINDPARRPENVRTPEEERRIPPLRAAIEKLRPLHKRLGEPEPGDWRAVYGDVEQTFDDFLEYNHRVLDGPRRVLYIQPIGEFTRTQHEIIVKTAGYMAAYFNVPVEIRSALPLSLVGEEGRRTHPAWGGEQILTTHLLRLVLGPRLPDDAVAYIGLTAEDLWPGGQWNFVFGQAATGGRIGVYSMYRFGNPDESDKAYKLCLRRTMKLATHETGHIFFLRHCTQYECNMCGCNHLEELDRHPLHLCAGCMAKVCFALAADPSERYKRLLEICRSYGFEEEAAFFEKAIGVLGTHR